MTFRKGDPKPQTSGRRTGVIRRVLEAAAHEIGGLERLVAWIREDAANERLF
jgi:hypothetical protein